MVVCRVINIMLLVAVSATRASSPEHERILVRLPRQSHGKNGQQDQSSAETGFLGGGGIENSKYFHYQHLPEHDKYEFGHRRGNEHHVVERYEKAIPHEGQFKTKVRWADKKGGHGEHYWDYNHAGHGGNGHGGQNDGDKSGGYSDLVPVVYSQLQKPSKHYQKRQLIDEKVTLDDVETSTSLQISDSDKKEKEEFVNSFEKDIGGLEKYDIQKEAAEKQKKTSTEHKKRETAVSNGSHLFFDLKSGEIVDELTGKKYILQPIN